MKKQYESPELEIMVLEQSDIITASVFNDAKTAVNGVNNGEEHRFTWTD